MLAEIARIELKPAAHPLQVWQDVGRRIGSDPGDPALQGRGVGRTADAPGTRTSRLESR